MSVLAGLTNHPFRRFLVVDLAGEMVSAAAFLRLGYAVGANWRDL